MQVSAPDAMKEAAARIRINKLLETAGWRFFADSTGPANVRLEPKVALTASVLDALGQNFEKTSKGFVDFLLLDEKGFPLVVLEAKAENKNPLIGKEQARKYARSLACRFVVLSNGTLHYFWDLDRGSPSTITALPTPTSMAGYRKSAPDAKRLVDEPVGDDYVVVTQRPTYSAEAGWKNPTERPGYIQANKLRFLRPYQLSAIHALQAAVRDDRDRFLFEMATGTGKTLTAAAIIKLFLRTGNAQRVLFLVDRIELEDQAKKAFVAYLSADYKTVVYKENRDDWSHAEIVVTTVQSLLINNKYLEYFSPTDFDLVISDEAHRSIGGNARAVFDYFVGYKLGLTATPRDYLRKFDPATSRGRDPREAERRLMLDTYRTFGCENSQPTFRYSLLEGVKDGFLINPTVVDARTDITTKLLSDDGFVVSFTDEAGEDREEAFKQREFEKRFFADSTNQLLCKTFLEKALRDPVSGEMGKSIVFAVSQNHAAKLTQIFNQMADRLYPGRYQSDFAVQVTSLIGDASQFAMDFSNNTLMGNGNFLPEYKTSKARVCVTVGMMTTGYDCTDILNIGLFRPIFSPTDFIQIKGRGTRRHDFREQLIDETRKADVEAPLKTAFKLFDFFANCEYFEEGFNYDEVLVLPPPREPKGSEKENGPPAGPKGIDGAYDHAGGDLLATMTEEVIGERGMKIDRKFFDRFEEAVRANETVATAVDAGDWDRVLDYVNRELLNKPDEYYTIDKLRKAAAVDRRLSLREILEKIFQLIPRFKSRDELLEEEFNKFVAEHAPEESAAIPAIRTYFKAYVTSGALRDIIAKRQYTDLATNALFSTRDYRAVPEPYRQLVPAYVLDYVSLNSFAQ